MAVWQSVNYSTNYYPNLRANMQVWYDSSVERWALVQPNGGFDLPTTIGPSPAIGDDAQTVGNIVFTAMAAIASRRYAFLDPNYSLPYGGANPNALSLGSGGHLACFDCNDDTDCTQLRISAGVPLLKGPGAITAVGDVYRRAKAREILFLTDTVDREGNTCAAGMRAYLRNVTPSLDSGRQVLCTAPGVWIYDNAGMPDTIDNISNPPNQIQNRASADWAPAAQDDVIQYAWFYTELRAIYDVLAWADRGPRSGIPCSPTLTITLAAGTGGSAGPGANWAAAKTSAVAAFANTAPFGPSFEKYATGLWAPPGMPTGTFVSHLFNSLAEFTDTVPFTFTVDLEQWVQTKAFHNGGMSTEVDTFDANGSTLTNNQWTKYTHQFGGTAGGSYTADYGDGVPSANLPNWCTDPSLLADPVSSFVSNGFVVQDDGGGAGEAFAIVMKADVSSGFVYQHSTP